MDNVALILKNYGYKLNSDDEFSMCPLCKSQGYSGVTDNTFHCDNCTPTRILVKDFLAQLNINVDTSPTDIKELLEKHIDTLLDPQLKGFKTGYSKMDYRTNGLLPDHLYILASETGMGKSVFSTNLLINVSKNHHVSYYDLENGKLLMLKRFIAIASMQPVSIFDSSENITSIIKAGEELSGRITFRDQQMLEPYIGNFEGVAMSEAICNLIRADVKKQQTKVVVIDPLENFDPAEVNYNVTGKVVETFKNLAQELHIAIIINSHLKKSGHSTGKRVSNLSETIDTTYRIPTLEDISGSAKITNKATDVWTIVRQKEDQDILKRGRMIFRILKSREDRTTNTQDLKFFMSLQNLKIVEVDFSR